MLTLYRYRPYRSWSPTLFEDGTERVPLWTQETDSEVVLTADLPGIPRDSLTITYDHDWLSVTGKRANVEYTAGCTVRNVDATKADASVKDGVLTIRLPKTNKKLKIEVQ
jgi:HSP20 family protein